MRTAIERGVNFFDLCASGKNVYAPFGRAIAGQRDKVYFQLHFGAVYKKNGDYAWSRDLDEIKRTFAWELETLGTDTIDMGFLHCVDEDGDYDKMVASGLLDYVKQLKAEGVVGHIGFSSHTPSAANRVLDTGLIDMMMFSINPAYDYERGDDLGVGSVVRTCAVLPPLPGGRGRHFCHEPFFAGKLLSADASPFHQALTHEQCIQYALDRPGVLTVVPGVRDTVDLEKLLGFFDASEAERDYSVVGTLAAERAEGSCVYCNHCQPCPAQIDIGLVNRYYDLARAGDRLAAGHYDRLDARADACLHCGQL